MPPVHLRPLRRHFYGITGAWQASANWRFGNTTLKKHLGLASISAWQASVPVLICSCAADLSAEISAEIPAEATAGASVAEDALLASHYIEAARKRVLYLAEPSESHTREVIYHIRYCLFRISGN